MAELTTTGIKTKDLVETEIIEENDTIILSKAEGGTRKGLLSKIADFILNKMVYPAIPTDNKTLFGSIYSENKYTTLIPLKLLSGTSGEEFKTLEPKENFSVIVVKLGLAAGETSNLCHYEYVPSSAGLAQNHIGVHLSVSPSSNAYVQLGFIDSSTVKVSYVAIPSDSSLKFVNLTVFGFMRVKPKPSA